MTDESEIRLSGSSSGLDESGEWVPAFEGQRPPFEPSNQAAVRHGAYAGLRGSRSTPAMLVLTERAEELALFLRESMDRFYAERFEPAIQTAALAGARFEAAMQALLEAESPVAFLDECAARWAKLWLRTLAELGLTPLTASRLGLNLAMAGDELTRYLEQRAGEK